MLSGRVEIDETYVGGDEEGVQGRQTETKAIVAIAVEVHSPKGFGRIRLKKVPDVSAMSLQGFIQEVVQKGTVVVTDGWPSYNSLSDQGYIHKLHVLSGIAYSSCTPAWATSYCRTVETVAAWHTPRSSTSQAP